MHSRWVTISAILGLVASIVFSLIGYVLSGVPVGIYFAILIFSITLILLLFYIEFSNLIFGLQQLIRAGTYKFRSLQKIIALCAARRATLYLTSVRLLEELATSSAYAKIQASALDVYVSPSPRDSNDLSAETIAQIIDRFHNVYFTPARFHFNLLVAPVESDKNLIFLASPESLDFSDDWISAPSTREHAVLTDVLNEEIIRHSISIRRLQSVHWLLGQYAALSDRVVKRGQELAAGMIRSTSPEEIYAEQIALSRGAKGILALDMTEVDEWTDKKGLGKCLEENILSGQLGDADIRRIFLCKSRAFMAANPAYRQAIAEVIKAHFDNGLEAGLVYHEDVKDSEMIRDAVVYDKEVVWVETVPTTRFSGAGYFSTDKAQIAEQCEAIERLWAGEFTRSPRDEARDFLNDCANA